MELTLDDYLAEFDRWKERAADKRKAREEAKQPTFNDEALHRMETRIGHPLQRLAPGEMPRADLLRTEDPTGASNSS